MSAGTFKVSLRVSHPRISADEIARLCGLVAKHHWTVGKIRMSPNGRLLGGIYPDSFCTFPLDVDPDETLEECLHRQADHLLDRSASLNSIVSTGGSLEFFVGWFLEGNQGAVFLPETLGLLASLGIGIGLCAYPPDRQSAPAQTSA